MNPDELDHALETSSQLRAVLDDLEDRSRSFGSALTTALKGAALDGDSLSQVLQGVAMRFSAIALNSGLAPLQNSLTSAFSGLTTSLGLSLSAPAGGGVSAPASTPAATPVTSGEVAPQVVFNVQASDAQSFRRSESQINAMLTRAVGRGRRGI